MGGAAAIKRSARKPLLAPQAELVLDGPVGEAEEDGLARGLVALRGQLGTTKMSRGPQSKTVSPIARLARALDGDEDGAVGRAIGRGAKPAGSSCMKAPIVGIGEPPVAGLT